ncbi:hypothetical protein JJQ59_15190 [Cupriavidus necator]|uniref:hypothetical protein n=1 Tax=Cupriavidus necator TaxID=106590 RepID=UPI0011BF8F84|nr:hypothetical protein [Cupriavidus necator]QQX83746.1 hypothetical protein JJQ59_15190 [Cupriavidus necator]
MILEGEWTEPVTGVSRYAFHLFPVSEPCVGQAGVPSVGSFIRTKPVMDGVVELSGKEFDFVVTLAASGRTASCSVAFQPPRYGRVLIVRGSFGTDPPTPDDEE